MFASAIFRVAVLGINLVLGSLAYRRNPRNATNVSLFFLTIAILFWGLANEFSISATTEVSTLWWTRGVMFFAVPVTILFFLLMYVFPRSILPLSKKQIAAIAAIAITGMATAVSPFLFVEIGTGVGASAKPVPGPGLPVFLVTAVVPIFLGIYSLVKKNWTLKGIGKLQARYLLAGASVMYACIFGLIVVPVVLGQGGSLVAYAPLFTLPFIATTTYAIIRHRMMDIRAAIFRSLSLTFLIGAVLGIYALLVLYAVPVVSDLFGISAALLAGGAALVSIPVARMVQGVLTKLTDRFLLQGKVDYGQELVKIGRDLSGTIQIEEVSSIVLEALEQTMRTRKNAILLQHPIEKVLKAQAKHNMSGFDVEVPMDNVLIGHLIHTGDVLVKDELLLDKEQESSSEHLQELEVVEDTLEWLDVSVVMPLFVNKELTGVILLGDKLSGAPYLQDDVEFLGAFAAQAATALENARLYKESLEFGEKLKQEVERATSELADANKQLRNLDKAKSEFLSIASHQLRTPLTALRGYVSMLQEGDFGKVPEKQVPILGILEKSSVRLIDLINSLLDISRIERGRLELNLESADLAAMAKELVTDLLPNAQAKGLILEMHLPSTPLPRVVVDTQRIRQVLLNFVDNSIKYTDSGRVDVQVESKGDSLVFSVTDTGKGISAEDLQRLFNKFTRVGGAAKFHTEGTGLGLYVAKQIVQEHHGEVFADSPGEGKGSTFSVRLPAEGSSQSLTVGEKTEVTIKAAEAEEVKERQPA